VVFRLFKVLILDKDINILLIYLFLSNYYIILYIYFKEGGVIFTLTINNKVEEEDISNLLTALSVIPNNILLVRGRDLFTSSAKALTKDFSYPLINKKVGVRSSVCKTFDYSS